ncbi:hypothetical protein SNEBB_004277 [Seison nebaliae]|nr:hypothetical protein SNEBB_004277 [Seison nebaliae]
MKLNYKSFVKVKNCFGIKIFDKNATKKILLNNSIDEQKDNEKILKNNLKNIQKWKLISNEESNEIDEKSLEKFLKFLPFQWSEESLFNRYEIEIEKEISDYLHSANLFAISQDELPIIPTTWSEEIGWTKYIGNESYSIDFINEDIFFIDVETLVKENNIPILATALGRNCWYSWKSPRFKRRKTISSQITKSDLIGGIEQERKQLIIGHNVTFDRSMLSSVYNLKNSKIRFLDTMSIHISINGMTSQQRLLYNQAKSRIKSIMDSEEMNEYEKKLKMNSIRFDKSNNWMRFVSPNNLEDVYNYHVKFLKENNMNDKNILFRYIDNFFVTKRSVKKQTRNIFVVGEFDDIKNDFQNLMSYCANDVKMTKEIFGEIWPKYLENFPSPFSLFGALELSTSILPVNIDNWRKYVNLCYQTADDYEQFIYKIIYRYLMKNISLENREKDEHFFDLDWSKRSVKLLKKKRKKERENNSKYYEIFSFGKKVEKDSDNSIEDDIEESQYLIPKRLINNSSICYPQWFVDLLDLDTSTDYYSTPIHLWFKPNFTIKNRIVPKILRLMWNESPLAFLTKYGWGRIEWRKKRKNDIVFERFPNTGIDDIGKWPIFVQLAHQNGFGLNIGNPLSTSLYEDKNELGSLKMKYNSSIINRLLDAPILSDIRKSAVLLSYWTNNEKRISSQRIIPDKLENDEEINSNEKVGFITPKLVVHGTVTRRATESTWLTASNPQQNRIGSELKSLVSSPFSYSFVGADIDAQELWIAATIADGSCTSIVGSTPIGWMSLSGRKNDGTDLHSKVAKEVNIDRNRAKLLNYARIYGASQEFAVKQFRQWNFSMMEAKEKASLLYLRTKGEKINNQWTDGIESEMFNRLERIALATSARTPFLFSSISDGMKGRNLQKSAFLNSRINWTVQSSAVDFLHVFLSTISILCKYFSIDYRFMISIHDEIRFIVPNSSIYRMAMILNIGNLLTRSMLIERLKINEIPISIACFSSVEIDRCLRKDTNDDIRTPSNPDGLCRNYGIPKGQSLTVDYLWQLIDKEIFN